MKILKTWVMLSLWMGSVGAQAAGHAHPQAHQHGVAQLDIAVDARQITLQLSSPLDNLLGFERAPRTEAERRQVQAMLDQLRAAATMFKIDPAAQCTPAQVVLTSAALQLGPAQPADAGHADLDGSFEFHCVAGAKATYVDVGLFAFARLQRVEVQAVTPSGQHKRVLKRPNARIGLTK